MKTSTIFALLYCGLSVQLVACGSSEPRRELADESTSSSDRPNDRNDGGEITPVDAASDAGSLVESGAPPASVDSGGGDPPDLDAGVVTPPEPVDAGETEPLRFADGAVVMFPEPDPPPPDPPEPGDALSSGDGDEDAGVGFAPDDEGLPFSSASLHVKIADGSYRLVEGLTPPDDRHESVINFVREEGGFHAYGLFPWDVTFLSFDAAPEYLPEREEIEVLASRTGAALRVAFEIDERVFIRSVVVEEFEP